MFGDPTSMVVVPSEFKVTDNYIVPGASKEIIDEAVKAFGDAAKRAVEAGFDTDCNGATVGSVLGMILGEKGIAPEWKEPVHGVLETTVQGVGKRPVSDFVDRTMKHILIT